MKKIKLNKTLQLSKETVAKLQEDQIAHVKGGLGAAGSCFLHTCNSTYRK